MNFCTVLQVRARKPPRESDGLKASQTFQADFHNIKMYSTKLALLAAIAPMASAFVSGPVLSYNKAARKFLPPGESAVCGCMCLSHLLLRTWLLAIRFLSQMLW